MHISSCETRKAVCKSAIASFASRCACGCSVGICGELAADEDLTEAFLRMGVDELSVAPARILPLRQKIRSLTLG